MEAAVESISTSGYKLVPWLGWDEWKFVRESLFSSSSDSVSSGLSRIVAWRSRGCLPVVIDVTASIIEIQQKDPFFRKDQTVVNLHSEEMLAMLYCMAIMRLVNGVVEKTRKQNEVSIADAADMIGIPRMLIDLRHEGSHRDLPSLRLLRIASVKALDWLNSYYWEPQRERVASQGDGTAKIREEIKSKLHEFIFHLSAKDSPESPSSLIKAKRSKKQVMKTKKTLIRLYSSFSSEVVSVLLEYVLKSTNSVHMIVASKHDGPSINNQQTVSDDDNPQTVSDDWKVVMLKLAKKEPKLLMDLLKTILDMIETETNKEYELGAHLGYKSDNHQIERLSSLFAWLVCVCKVLKPTRRKDSRAEKEDCSADTFAPRATLINLIHKCLLLLTPGNDHLMGSARNLAKMAENNQLVKKLKKLSFLSTSTIDVEENHPFVVTSEDLIRQENYLQQTEADLSVLKLRKTKNKVAKTASECDVGKKKRWVVAKSWNTCPIGMLPRKVGSSGCLPSLSSSDCHDSKFGIGPKQGKELWELKQCGKREAELDMGVLDSNSNMKKMKEMIMDQNEHEDGVDISDGIKGKLMIGGVWRKVTENEVFALRSHVRVMVV